MKTIVKQAVRLPHPLVRVVHNRTVANVASIGLVVRRCTQGYAEWPKFDLEVLGGNYHGHYGSGPKCTVTPAADAQSHPILAGVRLPFTSDGSLYRVSPLAASAKPLLIGTVPDKDPEPVAWTNRYGESRVFFTSLGHPDGFKITAFRKLLLNAVFWAIDKPVPNWRKASTPINTDEHGSYFHHEACPERRRRDKKKK